jgi:DNA repair protein RadC
MKFYVRENPSKMVIHNWQDVADSIKDVAQADQESFWLIGMNIRNIEVFKECIFLGGVSSCVVDPIIVFKRLLIAGCTSFICVHNHPSGNPDPSAEDRTICKRLKQGAELLNLNMLDNIIIAAASVFSFTENGLMS